MRQQNRIRIGLWSVGIEWTLGACSLLLLAASGCRTIPTASSPSIESWPAPPTVPAAEAASIQPVAFIEPVEQYRRSEEIVPLPEAGPPTNELSLHQLEQMALVSHPQIAKAVAEMEAAYGNWIQVGLGPNPRGGYAAEDIGAESTSGQQGGFISQQFLSGHKLGYRRIVADHEIRLAEQRRFVIEQQVLTRLRQTYYEVLIAQKKRLMATNLVTVSEQAVEASRQLLAAMEIPRIGLLQSQIAAQNARVLQNRARIESTAAWQRLAMQAGVPNMPEQVLADELQVDFATLEFDAQWQRILIESPEIAIAAIRLEQSRSILDREAAEAKPDVNVQLTFQHDQVSDDTLSAIQLGVDLPIWDRNQGAIHQAFSKITAAERNIDQVELRLRSRLTRALQAYEASRFEVEYFRDGILPQAEQSFELVSKGYKQGEIGYLDMLNAQKTYFETNLNYISALENLWQSKILIEGLLIDGNRS